MHQLGISIYPEHSTMEEDFAYMEKAAALGFTRIFTCLLSIEDSKETIVEKFSNYIQKAHELNFIVSVDTNPEVFKHLNASPLDISVFKEMQVDIIRLDLHFNDFEDIWLIQNPYGIKIEFNASYDTCIDNLVRRGADKEKMLTCHNFYPQKYTGLGWDFFLKLTKNLKEMGLHTAVFVNSHTKNSFGPWPISKGLVTCEMHRELPIDLQARHLLATGLIDDIVIGNAYASEEELAALATLPREQASMKLDVVCDLSENEKIIIYDYVHAGRSDHSDYMLRSWLPRIRFKKESIPVRIYDEEYFHRGDVVIVNDNCPHYRGELQVMLQDMPNDGERNFVGSIYSDEHIILDLLRVDIPFRLL